MLEQPIFFIAYTVLEAHMMPVTHYYHCHLSHLSITEKNTRKSPSTVIFCRSEIVCL